MSIAIKNAALKAQFAIDKAEGTTCETKFNLWLKEQTEERLTQIVADYTVTHSAVEELKQEVSDVIGSATAVAATATTGLSKSQIAANIFAEEMANPVGLVRKTCMDRFQKEANMSKAYANTAYQLLRDKHGLTVHKA